jgi:hypothetical protein
MEARMIAVAIGYPAAVLPAVASESFQLVGEISQTEAFARSVGLGMIGFGTLRTHSKRS